MLSREAGFVENAVNLLIRSRWPLLLAAIALTVAGWPAAQRLALRRTALTTLPKNNPYRQAYEKSQRIFGMRDSVIVAYPEPNLFKKDTLQLTDEARRTMQQLAKKLEHVPGVASGSVYDLEQALKLNFRREQLVELLEGMLIGPDHKTVALVLQLEHSKSSSVSRGETISQIRDIAQNHDPRAYVAGEPVIVQETYHFMEHDGQLLFRVSLGLLSFVTLILFRGLRWTLLPVAIVVAAIVWTRALLELAGFQLSMVSAMLNSLITIVAVATVMHVIVHFGRHCREGMDRTEAFRRTLVSIGPTILWTCATTAAGFAALLSSRIQPVRNLAIMMTMGAMLVFVVAAAILPGAFLIGGWNPIPKKAPAQRVLLRWLGGLARWLERHPWLVGATAIVLAAGTGWGVSRLRVQSDPTKNFRESTSVVASLKFIENRLGGTGAWEVNFPAPHKLTSKYLKRVESVSKKLRAIGNNGGAKLTKVNCLTDWIDLTPPAPFFLDTPLKRMELLQSFKPGVISNFYKSDAGRMRILLRSKQRLPSNKKLNLIHRVGDIVREEFPDAEPTGSYVLMAHTVKDLLHDQLISLGLATAGMLLMLTMAFRSLRIGVLALIPNFFPIVLVIGGMGWFNLPVNMGTAMIAAVSMGLTVDGTIHYIAGYRRARQSGRDRTESLVETHQEIGRALLFATAALVIGFSVLALSHFLPLVDFGILISFTMAGGLAADLLLFPVLLRLVE